MHTGDVVEITGAYFKNDNGLYFVEHTPGDPNWSGMGHCLRRIKRNGELSTAKDSICFWPISAFVNSRDKRAAANQWNQEHAEIEIKAFPHTEHIADYFASEADSLDVTIKRYTWDFGEDCQTVKDTKETQAFYRSVADGLRAEHPSAATTEQPKQQTPASNAGAEAPAEQPEATTAEKAAEEEQLENILDRVTADLEARKDRSAWNKGVTVYALELVEGLKERAAYEGRNPKPGKECREWMLNGAQDWAQYSLGGSSLIYDCDIAEMLCTPSELKKTRNGERRPNSREEWLDTQARALFQACNRVSRLYRSIMTA